jgi:hypothetical protein
LKHHIEVDCSFAEAGFHGCDVFVFEGFLDFFDEAENVTHSEDSLCHPVGIEHLEGVDLFSHPGKSYRDAGGLADGKDGSSACVAIEFCEDGSGDFYFGVEGFGDIDGFLAGG